MNTANELDLVRVNENLHFPANVKLNFIYWTHNIDNLVDLPSYLQNADAIAWETARIGITEGYTAKTAGRRLEKVMNHAVQDIANEEELRYLRPYRSSVEKVKLIRSLPKKPRLYLVDDYEGWTSDHDDLYTRHLKCSFTNESEYLDDALAMAEDDFAREHKTLGRLADIAAKLGRDGSDKELCILYGSDHTLLSVAARQLGAPVERHFAHKRAPTSVVRMIQKLHRFHLLPDLESMEPNALNVLLAAVAIDEARLSRYTEGGPIDSPTSLIKTVQGMDDESRAKLHCSAAEINEYVRTKLSKKDGSSPGRIAMIGLMPRIVKVTRMELKLTDALFEASKQRRHKHN